MTTTKVPMPAAWASYLMNDDASGLSAAEVEACDYYRAKEHITEVLDVGSDTHFSWNFDWYGGTTNGGELAYYTVSTSK